MSQQVQKKKTTISPINKYLRSFSPSDPETAGFSRRFSANFLSDSEALAGRFHGLWPVVGVMSECLVRNLLLFYFRIEIEFIGFLPSPSHGEEPLLFLGRLCKLRVSVGGNR